MILYRISRKLHINDLSGTGAMLFGGRWNKKGVCALYTSQSVSLAVLESIANLSAEKIDSGLHIAEIQLPANAKADEIQALPEEWNTYPHVAATVNYGTDFLKKGGFCLKVPSALVPTEFNYIVNPLHGDFSEIKIIDTRPLILDKRLM